MKGKVRGTYSDSFYYDVVEGIYSINKKNEERVYKYRSKLKKKRKAQRNRLPIMFNLMKNEYERK